MSNLSLIDKTKLFDEIRDYVVKDLNFPAENVTNILIHKFLNARKYKIEETKKMLKKYVEFQNKITSNPDKFMKIDPKKIELIKKCYCEAAFEIDKDGYPVSYSLFPQINVKKIFETFEVDDLLNYFINRLERSKNVIFPVLSAIFKKRIDQFVTVIDFKDISPLYFVKGKAGEFTKRYFTLLQDNYPEILKKTYILNTSAMFKVLFSFVKLFVDKKTISKVEILKDNYLPALCKTIPIENIPNILGGKSKKIFNSFPGPWQPFYDESEKFQTWNLDELCDLMENQNQNNQNNQNIFMLKEIKKISKREYNIKDLNDSMENESNIIFDDMKLTENEIKSLDVPESTRNILLTSLKK